jgi:hypothetical protein
VKINNYFELNPQNVLGQITVGNGMYGEDTVSVKADDLAAVPQLLAERLDVISQDALDRGLGHSPAEAMPGKTPAALLPATGQEWDGTITAQPDGTFTIARVGEQVPFPVPKHMRWS